MSSTFNPSEENTIPASPLSLPVASGTPAGEKEEALFTYDTPTLRMQWIDAFKHVWPIYLASHIAFLLLTYLATLFSIGNFSTKTLRISSLLEAWNRWDTGHFTLIAD